MNTDPQHYRLPARVQLEALDNNTLGIRKIVKSRIIRKDAVRIAEMARQIKHVNPDLNIALLCTRNICSKSIVLLHSEGIEVRYTGETE